LVARIRFVYLGPSGGWTGHGAASEDSIDGVLIVRAVRSGLAVETPLRAIATYNPNASDETLVEKAYHGRLVALAQAFAGATPGQLGL
jgi:hypothetical protein